MTEVGIGIIGCGNISSAYLKAAKSFRFLVIRALADAMPAAAEARAAEFGLRATSVEALLADPAIEIVVNLTVPKAHVEVGLRALAAGKHVYSEKPLGIRFGDGRRNQQRHRGEEQQSGLKPRADSIELLRVMLQPAK